MEYGDPFETRDRKPFDHWKLWSEFTNAYERKYLGNVTGYGMLVGTNVQLGPMQTLLGVFQHFNYFDNLAFEYGGLAFGGGLAGKLPITDYHNFYTNIQLALTPFAANNAGYAPIDTTQTRDYSYGDGFEVMTETGFSIGHRLIDLSAVAYYIYFHSYYGVPVNNTIVLVKPRISLRLWKNLGIGFEHQLFTSNRTASNVSAVALQQNAQRLFIQWNWDDFPKE